MREEECKRRLFSNSSCRLACPEVNHLREKLGLPLVAKREVVPVVPKQKRGRVIPRCKCGGTALLKKLIPRPLEPICRECHAIARYVYVQSASMPDKARNDARRTGMKAIIEAASNGHLPSQQWVAKNVK
jgi:hypothetical protein